MGTTASENVISSRRVQILFRRDSQVVSSLELQVMPRREIIDHVFRFHEPQNSHSQIVVPAQFDERIAGVYSSNPYSHCEVD